MGSEYPSKWLVVPTICNTLSFVNFRFQLIRSARLQSHFSEALYFESAMAAHVSSPESRTGQTQHLIFASLSQLDFRVYEELLQFVNLCLSFSDPRSQLLLASPIACRHRYSTSSIGTPLTSTFSVFPTGGLLTRMHFIFLALSHWLKFSLSWFTLFTIVSRSSSSPAIRPDSRIIISVSS